MFYVLSHQVDNAYAAGDYDGAWRSSNIAKWLNVAAIICGIIVIVILATTL